MVALACARKGGCSGDAAGVDLLAVGTDFQLKR